MRPSLSYGFAGPLPPVGRVVGYAAISFCGTAFKVTGIFKKPNRADDVTAASTNILPIR